MEPVAAKVEVFGKNIENESDDDLSKDFEEAISIIGIDQPAFSFSEDYNWMVETTKQILLDNGIEYFRGNVLNLMKAWNDFAKS